MSNVNTKRATDKPLTEVYGQWNSWDGWRGTVDINRPILENLFFRVAAMADYSDTWRDQSSYERNGIFLTTTWRPFEETEIRFEFENGNNDQFFPSVLLDSVSEWDRTTTVAAPLSANVPGGVVQRRTADYLVYNSASPARASSTGATGASRAPPRTSPPG